MFEILIQLMNEAKVNMGSIILEEEFNLSLTKVEDEINRLAQIPACTIEAIRSEVETLTDILVDSPPHDPERFIDVQKQRMTKRINAVLQALSEQKSAKSLRFEAGLQDSVSVAAVSVFNTNQSRMSSEHVEQFESAMKQASGEEDKRFLRRQRRYPIDIDSLHANKSSSSNASRNDFLSTPDFLPLTDKQRQEMQAVFSSIDTMLQANNLEGMQALGPMLAKQTLDILVECKHLEGDYGIFTSRMTHIHSQAHRENATLLVMFIDNIKEIMQNSAQPSTLRINVPSSAACAEEDFSDGRASSRFTTTEYSHAKERERFQRLRAQESSSYMNFFNSGVSRENVVMRTIQALDASAFEAWIEPLRLLLDAYAPTVSTSSAAACIETNLSDMEFNFSAQYLSVFIEQLTSIHQGRLVIDSVSDLDDLMNEIYNAFHSSIPKEIDTEQRFLIDVEIFGEMGDSVICEALMVFKSHGEQSAIARRFG